MLNFCTLLGTFALLTTTTTLTSALLCPDPSAIAPCVCSATDGETICEGPSITQASINQLFTQLRQANDIPASGWLELPSFSLQNTQMSTLELTPLFKTRLDELIIYSNTELSKIFGNLDLSKKNSIDTPDLYLLANALTDDGLADTFPYFSSTSLQLLYLNQNRIQGSLVDIGDGSGDIEFLPGLSAFGNLEVLELKQNKVSFLLGGQFKRNSNLTRLQLSSNKMIELGINALVFDENVGGTEFRYIFLGTNQLSDAAISPSTGLSMRALETQVNLNGNGMEFISQANFQPFLDANSQNSLVLPGNAFICDERMKWLKDGIELYQFRVTDVNCLNDPGQTIFTTELV